MPPIYVMAAITLALSSAVWGWLLVRLSGHQRRMWWLLLPGLPLSAMVNLLIKGPLIRLVTASSGQGEMTSLMNAPLWYWLFLALLPPITEELIKVFPLAIPTLRRWMTDGTQALMVGLGLGISFGLGEAIYIAYSVAQVPAYSGYPWFYFTGYLFERFMVVFAHGALTALFAHGLYRRGWHALSGYGTAVGLHAALNLGAMLAQTGLISAGVAGLSVPLLVLILAGVFEYARRRADPAPRWT